jgi:hypothetical protein
MKKQQHDIMIQVLNGMAERISAASLSLLWVDIRARTHTGSSRHGSLKSRTVIMASLTRYKKFSETIHEFLVGYLPSTEFSKL